MAFNPSHINSSNDFNGPQKRSLLKTFEGVANSPSTLDWDTLPGKPSTFAPIIGTTATTAMAGNKTPTATQRGGVLLRTIANTSATDAAGLVTYINGTLLPGLKAAGLIS